MFELISGKKKDPGKKSLKRDFIVRRIHNNSLKTKGNNFIVEMGCATGIGFINRLTSEKNALVFQKEYHTVEYHCEETL